MKRIAHEVLALIVLALVLPTGIQAQSRPTPSDAGRLSLDMVSVRFDLQPAAGIVDRPLEGSLRLERADGASDSPVVDLPVGGTLVETRLSADSTWRLSVQVAGFWAPSGALHIGSEDKRVSLLLLPTGEIRGKLVRPQSVGQLPDRFYVTIESPRANARSRQVAAGRRVAGGRFVCPVDKDGSWRCELPAELLDLVLRFDGFVPVYRWDVRVVARQVRDLGTIRLESGSSVAGWVVTENGGPVPKGLEARLVPRVACGADTGLTDRIRQGADRHQVGEDGFFQFRGVAPGAYVVLVGAPEYATATLGPFEVREADETLLRQPAVLRPPVDLVLEIDPPEDFQERPWLLSAVRASDDSNGFDRRPLFDGEVSEKGRLVVPGQTPGLFSVTLRDADGNVFWKDSAWRIDTSEDAVRRIEIPRITVQGEVTLGDEPVPAEIWFGGRMGARRIELEADEEGLFEGVLPEAGEWWVEVASKDASLKRSLWVEVIPDEEGTATVSISLPDTEVSGVVLGPDGRPVSRASLSIDHAGGDGGTVTSTAGDDGRFRVRGLPPGELQIVALRSAVPHPASAVVETWIEEGVTVGPIVLRLVETRAVEGMVVSAGAPVAGASVLAMPDGGGFGDTARTDMTGRFALELRSDARFVTIEVAPPRGGLTAVRADISGEAPVVVDTGTDWGTLEVLLPEEPDQDSHPVVRLFQDEIPLSGQILASWLQANGLASRLGEAREMTLPRMAPGAYRVCLGEPGGDPACTAGYLAPGASLELSLR